MKFRSVCSAIFVGWVFMWVSGCGIFSGEPGQAFRLRLNALASTAGDPVDERPITQQKRAGLNGNVDILFMLDSSLSFTDLTQSLSTALTPLVGQMSDIDQVAIAFALAWGQQEPDALNLYEGSGHLYKTGSNAYVTIGNPIVDQD
ncbi:MAG: hypothetical protein V1798_06025, partial [Pseudomonadota bacterium]